MLISFIIAYHNEPLDMLRHCLQSIKKLQLKDDDHEVLVINDGSDVSPQGMMKGEFPQAVCIDTENQGLSEARNHGLRLAKGDYIQFIDSDDGLFPDTYLRLLTLLTTYQADMLMFRFSTTETPCQSLIPQEPKVWDGADFLCHNNLRAAACTYIFRRQTLDDLTFHPGIYHEDVLFTPQLILRAKRLISVKAEAYFYRQHEGSIMSSKSASHIGKRLADLRFVLLQLKGLPTSLITEREAMQRTVAQQTMVYIYIVATSLRSLRALRHEASQLKASGLMPLPLKTYNIKYLLFALATRML